MASFTFHQRKRRPVQSRSFRVGWCAFTSMMIACLASVSGQQSEWPTRHPNATPRFNNVHPDHRNTVEQQYRLAHDGAPQRIAPVKLRRPATEPSPVRPATTLPLARYPLARQRRNTGSSPQPAPSIMSPGEAPLDHATPPSFVPLTPDRLDRPPDSATNSLMMRQTESSNRSIEQSVGHRAADRTLQAIAASLQTTASMPVLQPTEPRRPPEARAGEWNWPLGKSPFDMPLSMESQSLSNSTFPAGYARQLDLPDQSEEGESHVASFRSVLTKQDFRLADQPQPGEHYDNVLPQFECNGLLAPYCESDFSADPVDPWLIYDGASQIDVYQGKTLNANQRPLIEWGRRYYFLGQFPESYTFLGETNLVAPRFLVYGDYRTAFATNTENGNTQSVWAQRLNLDLDLKLTATERFHAFVGPLDHNNEFTRGVYDNGRYDFFPAFDWQPDAAFFEGDLGAIAGGLGNEVLPFDLPIAIGLMPLLFQNGIWMEDAILGAAATVPALNSPWLDLSNFDITFFAGIDKLNSPAFAGDDAAARLYGTTTFIEAFNGYFEAGYAYLEDRNLLDRSYHNLGISFTRRYQSLVSTSYRAIFNLGQDPVGSNQTADGALFLWENSLITSSPYTCVPYFNFFAGFGRPQSVARAAGAGGVLRNTGIVFETDGLTGSPTLDATGNDTFGGAIGLNLLSSNFDQQLVAEFAFLNTMGNDPNRNAPGDQYGFGVRYQLPLTNAIILRCDAMVGLLDNADDISGFRCELRHKF